MEQKQITKWKKLGLRTTWYENIILENSPLTVKLKICINSWKKQELKRYAKVIDENKTEYFS